jgi:N-acylneuraminate cytidylyltransferase/CMP-N,N'-diacetyllegionaminic acid synthase
MICIIPARAGSKGLKNKNLKKLNGKQLILHTVQQAQKCKLISKIVISTDDKRIINLLKNKKKVFIPFVRPKKLSTSNSSSIDVYLHCINFLKKSYGNIKDFCVLLPTSPLRTTLDITKAIKIFKKKKCHFLISGTECKPKQFHFSINKNNFLSLSEVFQKNLNRQFLRKNYLANGSIYIFNTNQLIKSENFLTKKTYFYLMPKKRSVDIDNAEDFKIAEQFIR